jgi:hypothetical protein
MELLPTIKPRVLAINFRAKAKPEERVLSVVSADGTVSVCRDEALLDGDPAALSVMHIGTTGAFRLEDRHKAEDWLNAGNATPAVGDVLLQSDQIRLRGDRALVVADAKHVDEYLCGLAGFAHNEKQIFEIETKISELWGRMRREIPLTEGPRIGELGRQGAIDRLVGELARIRMNLVTADQAIYRPASVLSPTAQRVANELALTSRHADRVEALDERLEVLEDTYQRISDRMLELRLHRRELIVEWVIALILFVEAFALLRSFMPMP